MRYIIALLLTTTAVAAEVPVVVTDIPPVHSLAAAVMEGVGSPELLLEKGASEHHYQLKPSQAASIAEASLVIWIGPTLTPWLEKPLANRPEGAAVIALLDLPETHRQAYGSTGGHDHAAHDEAAKTEEAHAEASHEDHAEEGHDEHADVGHEEGEHADEHDAHAHSGLDPHAWLDPANGQAWTRVIAAELSQLDPENAATYAANAEKTIAAIAAADAEALASLTAVKDKPLVAFHDAWGYFTAHYGLTMAGTVALGDASMPGAKRLQGLRELVEAGGVACLFPEVQHNPALIAQLAEGTGVAVGQPLDPVGATIEPGPALYPDLLKQTALTIAGCAG